MMYGEDSDHNDIDYEDSDGTCDVDYDIQPYRHAYIDIVMMKCCL